MGRIESLKKEIISELKIIDKIGTILRYKKHWNDIDDITKTIDTWIRKSTEFCIHAIQIEKEAYASFNEDIQEIYKLVWQYFSPRNETRFVKKNPEILEVIDKAIRIVRRKLTSTENRLQGIKNIHSIEIGAIETKILDHKDNIIQIVHKYSDIYSRLSPLRKQKAKREIVKELVSIVDSIENEAIIEKDLMVILSEIIHRAKYLLTFLQRSGLQGTESIQNRLSRFVDHVKPDTEKSQIENSELKRKIELLIHLLDEKQKEYLGLSQIRDKELISLEHNLKHAVFVHMKKTIPPNFIIKNKYSVTGELRDTVHFTVNGPIGFDGFSDPGWNMMPVAILIPASVFPLARIRNYTNFDVFIFGEIKIPKESVMVISRQYLLTYAQQSATSYKSIYELFERNGIQLVVSDRPPYVETQVLLKKAGRGGEIKIYGEKYIQQQERDIAAQLGHDVTAKTHLASVHGEPERLGKSLDYLNENLRDKRNYVGGYFTGLGRYRIINNLLDFRIFLIVIEWLKKGVLVPYYKRVCKGMIDKLNHTLKTYNYVLYNINSRLKKANMNPITHGTYSVYSELVKISKKDFIQIDISNEILLFSPNAVAHLQVEIQKCIQLIEAVEKSLRTIERTRG